MKNKIIISGQGFTENYGRYSVQVSNVFSYTMDMNPTNKQHSHYEYEFNVVISGTGTYQERGREYELGKADMFISDPLVVHEIQCRKTRDLKFFWLNVFIHHNHLPTSSTYEDRLIDAFLEDHDTFLAGQHQLLDYLTLLEHGPIHGGQRKLSRQLLTKSLFFEILEMITHKNLYQLKLDNVITKKPFSYINLATNYIMNNLTSRLTVKDIADTVHTSERNLRYLFRQHLNTTVIGYINDRKMEHAARLLKLMFSVQDVATTLQIDDPAQFSRSFKRHYYVSPKQFQMNHMRQRKRSLMNQEGL